MGALDAAACTRGRLHRPVRRDARSRHPPAGRAVARRLRGDRAGRRARRADRRRHGRLVGRRAARRGRARAAAAPAARARDGLRHPGLDRAGDARAVLELLRLDGGDARDLRRGEGGRRAADRRHHRRPAGRARARRRRAGHPAPGRLPAARGGRLLARHRARGRRAVRRRAVDARRDRGGGRAGRGLAAEWGPRATRTATRSGSRGRWTARSRSSPARASPPRSPTAGSARSTRTPRCPAFASKLPEHDHNEIVGWAGAERRLSAVFLEDPDGTSARAPHGRHGRARGRRAPRSSSGCTRARETRLERLVSLVLLGDLVSLYLAVLRGVDPVDVRAIDMLKERLAPRARERRDTPGAKVG